MFELIVAASLLIGSMVGVSKLAIASGRTWQLTRYHQLALDDLTNQIERLALLPADERRQALEILQPSERVRQVLANATLSSEVVSDALGQRLVLTFTCDESDKIPPLQLVGWLTTKESDR